MRPRCSILTGGFDFSGCGDCTSCPPFEHTEMSNSEPSAIVLQGIPCMCGLYKVSIRMEKTVRSRFAAIHPFYIAHEVSNWLGIARREPGVRDRKVSQIACSSPPEIVIPIGPALQEQNWIPSIGARVLPYYLTLTSIDGRAFINSTWASTPAFYSSSYS